MNSPLLSELIDDYHPKVVVKHNSAVGLYTTVWVPQQLHDGSFQLRRGRLTEVQHLSEKIEQQLSLLVPLGETFGDVHLRWQLVVLVPHSLGVQVAFDVSGGHPLTYFRVAELGPVRLPQPCPATLTWNRRHENKTEGLQPCQRLSEAAQLRAKC